jgi:pimeloyl-ACP methyl ester carboxylesterase
MTTTTAALLAFDDILTTSADRLAVADPKGLWSTEAVGVGETVLWIHGYTLDSTLWSRWVWPSFPSMRHIAVDLPGHGRSRPMADGESLASLGRELAALIDEFGVRHLVGMSFGGIAALQAAAEASGKLRTLTLVSTGLGGLTDLDPDAQGCNIELGQLYKRFGPGRWLADRWWAGPPAIFGGLADRPSRDDVRLVVERHGWSELSDSRMNQFVGSAQDQRLLRNIRARTLVLVGEDDLESSKVAAEKVRRWVPGASRQYLSGVGHLGLLESAETLAPRIVEHIVDAAAPTSHCDPPVGRSRERI